MEGMQLEQDTKVAVSCLDQLDTERMNIISSGEYTEGDGLALRSLLDQLTSLKVTTLKLCATLAPKAKVILSVFTRAQKRKRRMDSNRRKGELDGKHVGFITAASAIEQTIELGTLQLTKDAFEAKHNILQQLKEIHDAVGDIQSYRCDEKFGKRI